MERKKTGERRRRKEKKQTDSTNNVEEVGQAKRSNYITKKEAKQLNCKQPKEENKQTD